MAVDSSVYSNLLSTGGVFYVVRSLAVCRNVEQKLLESDSFSLKVVRLLSEILFLLRWNAGVQWQLTP